MIPYHIPHTDLITISRFQLYLKNEIPQLFPDHIQQFSRTTPNHIQIILWHVLHTTTAWTYPNKQQSNLASLSANADGPRDAASQKIDHIALPTKYNYQETSISRQKIATQTEKCQILAHIWMIMLKLHLVDLLLIYYTIKFSTNTLTNWTDGA